MSYISVGRSHRDLITGCREQIDPTLIYKSMIHRYTARQIHKQSAAVRSVFPIDAQSSHACLYPVDVLYRGPIVYTFIHSKFRTTYSSFSFKFVA